MAGSLSSPNLIKDVYKKLVFYDTATGYLKHDNGSTDVDLLHLASVGDTDNDGRFEWNSSDAPSVGELTSGILASFSNNSVEKFSIDFNGVLNLATQSSTPTAVAGGLYFDGTNLFFGITE